MLFKIPREIERRRATPDMDLYDYVIGAYEKFVCIWHRQDNHVEQKQVFYQQVERIDVFEHFLNGILKLYTKETIVEIPFNTVSIKIIKKLVKIIRERYKADIFSTARNLSLTESKDSDRLDLLFVNLLRDMEKDENPVQIGAFQPECTLTLKNRTHFQKTFDKIKQKKVSSCIHLFNEEELILIKRDPVRKKAYNNKHSYEFTYIPLGKIRDILLADSPQYIDMMQYNIQTVNYDCSFLLEKENTQGITFYQNISQQLTA